MGQNICGGGRGAPVGKPPRDLKRRLLRRVRDCGRKRNKSKREEYVWYAMRHSVEYIKRPPFVLMHSEKLSWPLRSRAKAVCYRLLGSTAPPHSAFAVGA